MKVAEADDVVVLDSAVELVMGSSVAETFAEWAGVVGADLTVVVMAVMAVGSTVVADIAARVGAVAFAEVALGYSEVVQKLFVVIR